MKSRFRSLGLEAISFQLTGLLHKELTAEFERFNANTKYLDRSLSELDIEKIVKAKTGIKIKLKIDHCPHPNAYVLPPIIDPNHAILDDQWRKYIERNPEFSELVKKANGLVKGQVDLKNSTVSGIFSELEVPVFITAGLVANTMFTAAEKSAILLHELGHVFTMFEFLGRSVTTNIILHAATEHFFKTDDVVKKFTLLEETSKALDIKLDDPEALVKTGNKEVLQTVLLREVYFKVHSEYGSSTYDMTSWEALSDQFATRHGAGRDVVTALNKIYRDSQFLGGASYQSTWVHAMLTIFKVLLFMGLLWFTGGMALMYLFIDPSKKIYDDPEARFSRVRRELVASLKSKDIPVEARDKTLDDIEQIDKVLSVMKDKRGLMEFFYTSILPSGRRQYKQLQFQLQLEKLTNNDMFKLSSQFDQLKTKA